MASELIGNFIYSSAEDVPQVVPLFPLPGALLLPRAHMPLNIFEPRYIKMVDAALRTDRVLGLIQPDFETRDDELSGRPDLCSVGCLGRITAFQESGDGRYIITLSGISRFELKHEILEPTPYRLGRVDVTRFDIDFSPGIGEGEVDRDTLLKTLQDYLEANDIEADWDSVQEASNEVLVNALSMMSPYGAREKQALLEAQNLRERSDMLVALAEVELARNTGGKGSTLQ